MARSIRFIGTALLAGGAVLYFTLPRFNGGPACTTGETPLTDLALVRLYGAACGGPVIKLSEHPVYIPGATDSFTVSSDCTPLSLWVTTVDASGNESCLSNAVQLGGGAGVEPTAGTAVRWYDVAGRRVAAPVAPGIYFWRDGPRTGRIVVLR